MKKIDRFKEALKIQLQFISNSCQLYDNGCESEAIRIATSISTLMVDTTKQTSIITHLMGKDTPDIELLSTSMLNMDGVNFYDLLTKVNQQSKQAPLLDTNNRELMPGKTTIKNWLNQNVISINSDESQTPYKINRHLIIITARDKDGGAHLDANINKPEYVLLKDGIDLCISDDNQLITTTNLHYAALRQMGYEVLGSNLDQQLL